MSSTVEKMVAGQRVPRNLLISETLRDYSYSDARGMGVREQDHSVDAGPGRRRPGVRGDGGLPAADAGAERYIVAEDFEPEQLAHAGLGN